MALVMEDLVNLFSEDVGALVGVSLAPCLPLPILSKANGSTKGVRRKVIVAIRLAQAVSLMETSAKYQASCWYW